MVETKRTQTEILALLPDNNVGKVSPQDHRDAVVSARANEGAGWAFYSESTAITQGTAQGILANTRTKMLCDGAGAFTTTDQSQNMPPPAWASNAIWVEQNCAYIARLTFKAQVATAGQSHYLSVDLDIGEGGLGTGAVIWAATEVLIKGSGVEHSIQYSIPLFAKEPFPTNGGTFWIECDVAADIWDVRVLLARIYKPDN